jgi:pimeloyl-ACP methyl ester carboxylesterase
MSRRAYPLVSWGLRRRGVRAALLAGQFGHPGRVPAEPALHMTDVLRDSSGYDDTLRAANGEHFRDGDAVDVPVSILWGTRDSLLLPRQAPRAKRAVRGAKLTMLRGGGHFAHWDEPDAVLGELLS